MRDSGAVLHDPNGPTMQDIAAMGAGRQRFPRRVNPNQSLSERTALDGHRVCGRLVNRTGSCVQRRMDRADFEQVPAGPCHDGTP